MVMVAGVLITSSSVATWAQVSCVPHRIQSSGYCKADAMDASHDDVWERASQATGVALVEPPASSDTLNYGPLGFDADDCAFVGPIKPCDACDIFTNTLNPFFMKLYLLIFLRTPNMVKKKWCVWARYDSSGRPESSICCLCSMLAYHGRKQEGGKRYLTQVCAGGEIKENWKSEKEIFIQRVLSGAMVHWKAAAV